MLTTSPPKKVPFEETVPFPPLAFSVSRGRARTGGGQAGRSRPAEGGPESRGSVADTARWLSRPTRSCHLGESVPRPRPRLRSRLSWGSVRSSGKQPTGSRTDGNLTQREGTHEAQEGWGPEAPAHRPPGHCHLLQSPGVCLTKEAWHCSGEGSAFSIPSGSQTEIFS